MIIFVVLQKLMKNYEDQQNHISNLETESEKNKEREVNNKNIIDELINENNLLKEKLSEQEERVVNLQNEVNELKNKMELVLSKLAMQ